MVPQWKVTGWAGFGSTGSKALSVQPVATAPVCAPMGHALDMEHIQQAHADRTEAAMNNYSTAIVWKYSRRCPDNSVDSIVTDPPYGLRFMGRKLGL